MRVYRGLCMEDDTGNTLHSCVFVMEKREKISKRENYTECPKKETFKKRRSTT